MLKLILFDIDDTLLDFTACSRESTRLACKSMGVPFSDTLFSAFLRINPVLWREIEQGKRTKEALYAERWNLIFEAVGMKVDGPKFELLFHDFLAESAEKVPGALETVQALAKWYPLGAASNGWSGQQRRRMEKSGLAPYFSHWFFSEDIGAAKPSRAFFDAVMKELPGISPEEILLVGDSLTADISGAKQYGIRTCWFNPGRKPDPEKLADHEIHELGELLEGAMLFVGC